jgi:uncharacterized protein (TIGR02172 family)
MSLGSPIALGFTAEIFAWQDEQVLKLFNSGITRNTVEYEANIARIVHAAGLPVPAVGEIIESEERFGLEYERVDGITMVQAFTQKPWKFPFYARLLAELQVDMHTRRVPELLSLGERLVRKINRAEHLPENVRQAALKKLEQLPEDDKLCHGDFHPGNILLTQHGPVIIDWMDASRGRAVLDVARSSLLFGGGPIPPNTPGGWLLRILQRQFYLIYKRRYFQLNPTDSQQLSKWIPVVAAARLDENITIDEGRLLSIAQTLIQTPEVISIVTGSN